jgi:hypothetical protein
MAVNLKYAMIEKIKNRAIKNIAKDLGVNRETLRMLLIGKYPTIYKNYNNPRLRKYVLDTKQSGVVNIENKGVVYKIDKRFTLLFKSLCLRDNGSGYLAFVYKNKTYYYHRLVTNAKSGQEVDHKSRNKKDNTLGNLRLCTRSENVRNRPSNGVVDVGRNLKKRYSARIMSKHIAYFETYKEAENCYKNVARIIHGEYYCEGNKHTEASK